MALSGCTTLPGQGPRMAAVTDANDQSLADGRIKIVDVTDGVARELVAGNAPAMLSQTPGDGVGYGSVLGSGDALSIEIWEAPPATLFSSTIGDPRATALGSSSRAANLPEQVIDQNGQISVPFAGTLTASGRTPNEVAADIRNRLRGKAHDPQVIVRLARNSAYNVTVIGEVANSVRMPLTVRGERLLDALASAGGVRQPVGKMTIQITRGDRVNAMALESVIKDPQQNIRLQADDVVTLLFQPYSFTVLGAAGKNEEVPFEGTGLKLSQALGRMGGLLDQRANARGVFIFRFEDPKSLAGNGETLPLTKDGKVPVIYRVDLKDPKTFFVAQSFPIKDKDVIYVANAPLAEFGKFLQAVSQIVYPIATIQNANVF